MARKERAYHEYQAASVRQLRIVGPVLLLTLIFTVCCGILVCVFLRASAASQAAQMYQAAVQLCRNDAARLQAGDVPEDGATRYFDAALAPCAASDAAYQVTYTRSDTQTGAGTLCTVTMAAGAPDAAAVYTLTTTVYLPAWAAEGGA